MTPRVPLVCTPEAARQLFFALSDYFVTLQAGINDPARVLGLIDALFRPAEEPAAPPPAGEPTLTHDLRTLRQAWNDAENENERLSAEVAALRAENERLRQHITDLELDLRYVRVRNEPSVPPGENRSEG